MLRNPQGLEKHLTGHIANLPDFRFGRPSTSSKCNSGVRGLPYSSTAYHNAARSVAPFNAGFVRTYVGVRKCVRRLLEVPIQALSCFRDPSPARRACVSAPNIVSLGRRLGSKDTPIHRKRRPSGVARGGVGLGLVPETAQHRLPSLSVPEFMRRLQPSGQYSLQPHPNLKAIAPAIDLGRVRTACPSLPLSTIH